MRKNPSTRHLLPLCSVRCHALTCLFNTVVRRCYTSPPVTRAATITLLSYQQTLIREEKDGAHSAQNDAAHRRPSLVPFWDVASWRWFMILANNLFTYADNISTDICKYTITSLHGYNQQKYYIIAITASTEDIGITENTSLTCTDWKSIIYLHRHIRCWNRCILGSWIISTDADGLGVVSLTFHELSKIFSRISCTAEIVLLMRISSWHFVRVPTEMLWTHVQSFSLKLSP